MSLMVTMGKELIRICPTNAKKKLNVQTTMEALGTLVTQQPPLLFRTY